MKGRNQAIGQRGEDYAVTYLKRHGYRILQRNFRCQLGEIDIIARQGKCLVFVEVKTRASDRFGSPEEAVTWAKQAKLRAVASFFLKGLRGNENPCRFDVLALTIQGDTISANLIKDAF